MCTRQMKGGVGFWARTSSGCKREEALGCILSPVRRRKGTMGCRKNEGKESWFGEGQVEGREAEATKLKKESANEAVSWRGVWGR